LIRKGDHITEVGRMKFRVEIQSRTGVSDGMGGSTVSWATTATVWADIQPLSMNERTQADRLVGDATHKLIIRNRTLAPTTQRILYGSRQFNIVSIVNPDLANSHLVVLVREEV
jgi:SPP1 family predicted phage head-tail adaptor